MNYILTLSFFFGLYWFHNRKGQVIAELTICCQFLGVLLYLRLFLICCTNAQGKSKEHYIQARHRKHQHTHRHTRPSGNAQWLTVRLVGGCNYTGALCEKCVLEMGSSLCSYLAWLLLQPRNTIVPEKDTMCMYTYVRVGMMWFYTEIKQKSPDTKKKRFQIHTPRTYDKGNWRGASVCTRPGDTEAKTVHYKRGFPSNFAISLGSLTVSCTHSSTMSCICANRFHFTDLVCSTKSGLEHPAYFSGVNIDRFTACLFLILTCCYENEHADLEKPEMLSSGQNLCAINLQRFVMLHVVCMVVH